MGLGLKHTILSYGRPVWQHVYELMPGKYSIDSSNLPAGYLIPEGVPVGYWHNLTHFRTMQVIKQGLIYEAVDPEALVIKVRKYHSFLIGDCIAYVIGGRGVQITEIESTTAEYDTFTLDGPLGVVIPEGAVVFQTGAKTDDDAALMLEPVGLLHNEFTVGAFEQAEIVVYGNLYSRRLLCGLCEAVRKSLSKERFIFSDSK